MPKTILKYKDLLLNVKSIYKSVKYTSKTVPAPFIAAIEEELSFAEKNFEAKYDIIIIEKFKIDRVLLINKYRFDIGQELVEILKNSEKLALFICTAGESISIRNRYLIKNEYLLEAYANDIIANLIVEKTADYILKNIKSQHGNTSNRYSSGNCGWHTLNQRDFFALFPSIKSGISLTDTQMMHPVKSLNGIIGIGKNTIHRPSNCNTCSSKNCVYRKNH